MRYAALLLITSFLVACGGAQKVGVRPTFKNKTVDKLAVVTVYATGAFSHDDEAFAAIQKMYLQATEETVQALGFQTMTVEQFNASFSDEQSRSAFWDGMPTHRPLDGLFEPDQEEPGMEVTTVTKYAESLPTETLLIAEIVYYTEGTCATEPREHSPYAVVEPAGADLPSECIVSHFQAKLVDAKSGRTMWHNRVLLERRNAKRDPEEVRDVIFKTVRRVLDTENGIATFQGASSS